MSFEDHDANKGEIYMEHTFDEINRKWNGKIIGYKAHIELYKTTGHKDEDGVRDDLGPVFNEFQEVLENGGTIEDLQGMQTRRAGEDGVLPVEG